MNIENTLQSTIESNSALLSDTGLNAGQVIAMANDLFNNEFDCGVNYSRESQLFFWDCVDDVICNAKRIQRHETAICL